ncbi:MAG TPA: MerR family transcriptional regulator [Kofleriaceae bacterium]|nr:MerR family transcriptional regulator [Kofleriaceae bacterium]
MSPVRAIDRRAFPYRMKDLCELTGLPRQAIHFYIQEGLVPEGRKTGRNMAYYGEAHVARIRLIRQLQHERFLPLGAIKAMLEERDDAFTPEQRRFLLDVKERVAAGRTHEELVEATPLLRKHGLEQRDLEEAAKLDVIAVSGPKGKRRIAAADVWMLELWGELRAAGFSRELGFTPSVLAMYQHAVATLIQREAEVFGARLRHVPPDRAAEMFERAVPLIGRFLARFHERKLRTFIAEL